MALILSGTHSENPTMKYELHAAQTAGSGNNRTIKLTFKIKVDGSSAFWYAYPMKHRFNVNGTWSGWYTTKGNEQWNGGQEFKTFEYNKTVDVGTTSSKGITVGFQVDSTDNDWDITKTATFTVGATNTAPYFDSSDYVTFRENNSSGAVITNAQNGTENAKKIGENVSSIYLSWPSAHDKEGGTLTYEVWYQSNESSWSKIKDTTATNFIHSIGGGNEGRSYDYYIKAKDNKSAVSGNCNGTQFQKNSFTTDTLASSASVNFNSTSIGFTYSGASNTTGNNSFTRTLSCDGIAVYNTTSFGTTAGSIPLKIWKSGETVPTTCYVKFDDIKNKFASSSYKGTLNFTLATRNAYGTIKTSSKAISVNLQVAPNAASSAAIAEDANSTAYRTVKTGTGATSTKYFIPDGSKVVRVNWGAGSGKLGESVSYDVYVAYGTGSWSLIASNLNSLYYNHVMPTQTASQSFKYKVRTKCSYNSSLIADRDTTAKTLHYYNGVGISVGTITRESATVSAVITVESNSSIPNINTKGFAKLYNKGTSTQVGSTDTLSVSQSAQTVSISGLSEVGAYDLKITYNDYTGLSEDKTHTVSIGQLLPVFDINKYGAGVGGLKADSTYSLKVKGGASLESLYVTSGIRNHLKIEQGSFCAEGNAGAGLTGYVKIASVRISGAFQNEPIEFKISQRGRAVQTTLSLMFASTGTSSTSVSSFVKDDNYTQAWVHTVNASNYDIYVQKAERYDSIGIMQLSKAPYMSYTHITYPNVFASSLPDGVRAATKFINYSATEIGALDKGNWSISEQDLKVHGKRALVGTADKKLYLGYGTDFTSFYVGETQIVSRGSNANGEYVRFYDGTQICWLEYTSTNVSIESPYGSLYQNTFSWTFPASFASTNVSGYANAKWGTAATWATVTDTSGTSMDWRAFDCYSRSRGTTTLIYLQAIGRWK